MSADWLVEPLEGGVRNGCLNCPDRPNMLPLETVLGVGFGMCAVTKDDETVWCEAPDDDEPPNLATFEALATVDPDHDWQVIFEAPLWSGTWQRQGVGEWLLIARGQGFA